MKSRAIPDSIRRAAGAALALLALLLHAAGPRVAAAQGTGRSMDIDGSVRSSAMGGASNALFWGGTMNHWGNPALLAYQRGVRYERGRMQLVPGLATDVWYTTNFTKLGGGGLGLVFGGEPAGPDGVQLDYGVSQGTDASGNPTGTFNAYEQVSSWGFGVSLLEAFDTLQRAGGARPSRLSRMFDVSAGMNFKQIVIALNPTTPDGIGTTTGNDYGVLARLTPIDGIASGSGIPVRADLSYGWSVLNYTDNTVVFVNEDQASPLTRQHRHGGAARIGVGVHLDGIDSPFYRALLSGLMPLMSVTFTVDRAKLGGGDAIDFETEGWGVEATVANIFSIRRGHYTDRLGDIDGQTRGYAVGVPFGPFGGFMYEESTFPQAQNSELDDVHRTAYAVWIDPIEIVAAFHRRGDVASAQ